MDAQELSQSLIAGIQQSSALVGAFPCSCLTDACLTNCRQTCSLEVVDQMLGNPVLPVSAVDDLLDLRRQLRQRQNAEETLRTFCTIRRQIETVEYLPIYRLRRWLEHHIKAVLDSGSAGGRIVLPLRLNGYCVEAIRRLTLCAALEAGARLARPSLAFHFVDVSRDEKPTCANPARLLIQ